MKLFCYGSNNRAQLAERCGKEIAELKPAYLLDHKRTFRGWSEKWGGGTASLKRSPGFIVYGGIAEVPDECLAALDRFEGVGVGKYKRTDIVVHDGDTDELVECQAYVSLSGDHNLPSEKYLEAVAKTIASCWTNEDGSKVSPEDIPTRD